MIWTVVDGLRRHPWVLGTALVWWLVAALLWARPDRRTVWSLLFWCALGGLAAVTLTPSRGQVVTGYCLPQWPRTGFGLWAANPERRWNVIIGVPLGLTALAWPVTAWGRPGRRAGRPPWSLGAPLLALAAPAVVESVQRLVPGLARQCALLDVVDNSSGVLLGFMLAAAGAVLYELLPAGARQA